MTIHEDEHVLCVPREMLPRKWIKESVYEPLSWSGFKNILEADALVWAPRSVAEYEPKLKQLIPYVLVKESQTGCMAGYRRRGSEDRLHGLWSVGIGGHVNKSDGAEPAGDGCEAIEHCVSREVYEELGIKPEEHLCRFLGIINEEITEVGTVHLGLVFKVILDDRQKILPGHELGCFQWLNAENIHSLALELWSRLAMRLFTGF